MTITSENYDRKHCEQTYFLSFSYKQLQYYVPLSHRETSFKISLNIIFQSFVNDSQRIFIEILYHPLDLLGLIELIIARISFSVMLNELRQVVIRRLLTGKQLDLTRLWILRNEERIK